MMRPKALAAGLLLGSLVLLTPRAHASGREQTLADLRKGLNPAAFSGARLSAQDQLILDATDLFISSGPKQKAWMTEALTRWQEGLKAEGAASRQVLAVTSWKDAGSLWTLRDGKAVILEQWSDDHPVYTGERNGTGRWFGFLGGQIVRGGDEDVSGFNARLGSTLFQNHYDTALMFGYASVGSVSSKTFGVLGRALFPLNETTGWNVGAQVSRFIPSTGDAQSTLSLLAGLNFYLPGGSFDVTLQAGNNSTYALLVGYSFYISQK